LPAINGWAINGRPWRGLSFVVGRHFLIVGSLNHDSRLDRTIYSLNHDLRSGWTICSLNHDSSSEQTVCSLNHDLHSDPTVDSLNHDSRSDRTFDLIPDLRLHLMVGSSNHDP